MKKIFIAIIFTLSLWTSRAQSLPQLGIDPVVDVIAAMTKEEKVRMVLGTKLLGNPDAEPIIGLTDTLVVGAAGTTFGIPRLGIPSIVMADGPAGVRISPTRKNTKETFYCTTFPGAMSLASTWNVDLVELVGETMGNEGKEYGIDILLTPALNIHRTPLCGRNFEYYSEDPLISGKIAAAMIRGIQKNGIGTSIKHFAANNQEINRRSISANMSERALREIYLKGFEIGINESQPWTVMSSYNKINGVYASESVDLLETILRKEWNFNGFVMSDWNGGKNPVAQMESGNDLLMPGRYEQMEALTKALNDGSLDETVLDKNIQRILEYVMRTPRFNKYKYSDKPNLEKHAEISRNAASEGIVLLKNDRNTLPFNLNKKIALFGNTSYEIYKGGIGSGDVHSAYSISIYDGLKNAGLSLSSELYDKYLNYLAELKKSYKIDKTIPIVPKPEMVLSVEDIIQLEKESDIAIITIGRYSGEFSDINTEYYYLTEEEKKMLESIYNIFSKKGKSIIVVLNTGSIIDAAEWNEKVDAILSTWYNGQEAGNAIADILTGKVNPSGKLATSMPLKYEDFPSSSHYPGYPVENPNNVDYCEDIYVGYRYFNTFNVDVLYEFGYGLSYTEFDYSDLKYKVDFPNRNVHISFKVKNKGKTAGKEIAQVYTSAPSARKNKPAKELKAFSKTGLLNPGDEEVINIKLNFSDLASFNEKESAWVVENGKYLIEIGASSIDTRLSESFNLNKKVDISKTSSVLPLRKDISILSPVK